MGLVIINFATYASFTVGVGDGNLDLNGFFDRRRGAGNPGVLHPARRHEMEDQHCCPVFAISGNILTGFCGMADTNGIRQAPGRMDRIACALPGDLRTIKECCADGATRGEATIGTRG